MQLKFSETAAFVFIAGFAMFSLTRNKQAAENNSIENGMIQQHRLKEDTTVINVDMKADYTNGILQFSNHK
jgi:hypothetical protein